MALSLLTPLNMEFEGRKERERRGTAHIELNNPQRIIPIIMLPQIGLHSRDPHRYHALDLGLLAEEPQRQVDIVDGTVHKDPAGELGVSDEEPAGIELVAGLRADHGGSPDGSTGHAAVGVAVGGVEAAGETAGDLLARVGFDGGLVGVDDRLRLSEKWKEVG